jgi:hypothetical protein
MTTTTTKMCTGVKKHGIPSHEAPLTAFCRMAANADGLDRVCKPCVATYTAMRKAAAKPDAAPVGTGPASLVTVDPDDRVQTMDALPADSGYLAAVGSDAGQQALADAAKAAAVARRARKTELQRERRAAEKAARA